MKGKYAFLVWVTAGVLGLGGCSILEESSSDTNNIRNSNSISDNQMNMKNIDPYKEYREQVNSIITNSKCYKNNDINDCLQGARYYHGQEGVFDEQKLGYRISELAYTKKACDLNNASQCYMSYAIVYENNMDFGAARGNNFIIINNIMGKDIYYRRDLVKKSLFKSCELKFAPACEQLASLKFRAEVFKANNFAYVEERRYITDDMSHDDIMKFAKKACDLNVRNCEMLAQIYNRNNDFSKANYYRKKMCKVEPNRDICEYIR